MNTTFQKLLYESDYRTIGYDSRDVHLQTSIEIIPFWSEGGHFITRNYYSDCCRRFHELENNIL